MPNNEESQERIRNMLAEFEKAFGIVQKKGSTAPDKLPSDPL